MKIHKEFFRYVIPSMLAFALSGIYAIADGFFVGNALGDNALAAINMAYPLTGTKTKNVAINFLGCPSSCLFWRAFF